MPKAVGHDTNTEVVDSSTNSSYRQGGFSCPVDELAAQLLIALAFADGTLRKPGAGSDAGRYAHTHPAGSSSNSRGSLDNGAEGGRELSVFERLQVRETVVGTIPIVGVVVLSTVSWSHAWF